MSRGLFSGMARSATCAAFIASSCAVRAPGRPPLRGVATNAPSAAPGDPAPLAPSASPEPAPPVPVASGPAAPSFAVTIPAGAKSAVLRAAFSADSKTIDVVREAGGVEHYDLATGALVASPTAAPPDDPAPAMQQGGGTVSLRVEGARLSTLRAVAREAGASIHEVDGASVLDGSSHPIGTDGGRFFWFEGARGTTLVRLDTGARATYQPWTNGYSGMGGRTGGSIAFDFGPSVDRAVVASVSQMGANVAFDDPRLIDSRTMTVVGSLPGTCQPFGLWWSPRGSFIARRECWTGRLTLSDGVTASLVRNDEPLELLAFSSDESLLAGRTLEGGLIVQRIRSGDHVLRLAAPNPTAVSDVLFSRDGKRLLVGRRTAIDVWDLETGEARTMDTRADGPDILNTDADTTAAWIDEHWLLLTGAGPSAPPLATSAGALDLRKLASRGEGFEVRLTLARPGSDELLVVGNRTETVGMPGGDGTTYVGRRIAVVGAGSGTVLHVFDDDTLDAADWAWTSDGAHLVTRTSAGLAILTPDLRLERPDAPPIALQPSQPLNRLVLLFGDLDGVVRAAETLSGADVAPIAAPRALHPSLRFLAFAEGPAVVVVDRSTGAKLRLSCADVAATRGCLATTEDGRFAASASIAPLLERRGETREQPDLVKSFFATAPVLDGRGASNQPMFVNLTRRGADE